MPARIGFDATAAVRQSAGIGRYTRELLAALGKRQDPFLYRAFYCSAARGSGRLPALDDRFRVARWPVSDRVMNALWHRAHIPLPVQLITGPIDLFHSPDFTVPPVWARPSILTVHDLAFMRVPNCAFPSLRAYLEAAVPRSVERANHIIAVSESTRQDLIELLKVDSQRVTTVLEGVDSGFQPSGNLTEAWKPVKAAGILEPFILSVGTLEPRKNYVRLLEAYALLRRSGIDHQLVIAGARGWMYEPIFGRRRELKLDKHVRILQPNEATLLALYQTASTFVYPSLYEGFGIPPLEAVACGTPVACSQAASLPEVVDGAALLFDPLDVDAIAGAMHRCLTDDTLRSSLTQRGLSRAAQLTWPRAAAGTVDVYRKVLGHA